jgi:FMN phosphatase YigB (HAD superfamily)/DNA-binding XRE family transcriptional regulator
MSEDLSKKSQGLGKAIQRARQVAGLTQQELCQQAEMSYSTLAKIERGAIKTPSVFTVFRLANILKVSIDELLGAVVDVNGGSVVEKKTSSTGVSFIYFDINGCLVRLFQAAFGLVSHETGIPSNIVETAFWHFNDAVCRGDITMDEFNRKLARQIGVESLDWNKYYFEAVEPIEEMRELVIWAEKHYRVGLLSNIMPGQVELMIEKGILPRVKYDSIIDSSQVKAIKPEQNIYEIAQVKAKVQPSEILFTDDSRTNLMAAERRGWQVIWFDDYRSNESAARVRSMLDF